jgi:RNA-directed DNA polymerase
LDNALTEEGYRFVRYADDVVILCRDEEEAGKALDFARRRLARLKLELSEEKTKITTFKAGFDFLGFRFKPGGRGIGSKSIKAFYRKVREATRRHQGDKPVEQIIETLNPILRGWGNYHKEGRNVGIFRCLDNWVRRRLRAYIYQRWVTRKWYQDSRPTKEDFERMGLFFLRGILRPKNLQLQLF